jgi:hypothetical protein
MFITAPYETIVTPNRVVSPQKNIESLRGSSGLELWEDDMLSACLERPRINARYFKGGFPSTKFR